jgi:PAS domain S-box-containing protein
MTVRSRLLATFGVILAVTLAILATQYWRAGRETGFDKRTEASRSRLAALMDLSIAEEHLGREVVDVLFYGAGAEMRELVRARERAEAALDRLERLVSREAEFPAAMEMQNEQARRVTRAARLRALQGDINKEINVILGADPGHQSTKKLEDLADGQFNRLVREWLEDEDWEIRIAQEQSARLASHASTVSILMSSAAVAIVLVLSVSLIRSISRSLGRLVAGTQRIAAGDLATEIPVAGTDELSSLAASFNQMAGSLRESTVSRGYLDNILRSVGESLIVVDSQGMIRSANEATCRLLGYRRESLVGQPWERVLVPEERGAPDSWGTIAEEIHNEERTYLSRDGRRTPVLLSRTVMRDAGGAISGAVCAARDITERKETEEALRRSEERFRDISHSTADWLWEVDAEGRYTYASGRSRDILGYEPAELIGRTPFDLMPDEEAERVRPMFLELVDGRRPIVDLENWNLTKDGRWVCLLTNGVPVLDADGAIAGYRGVDKDITERKRTEEMLRIKDSAIASSINAICIMDLSGKITYVNHAFLKMRGGDAEEALGKHIAEISHQKARIPRIIKTIMDRGSWVGEHIIRTMDGSPLEVQMSSNVVTDESGNPICLMASFIDLSDRRRAEEAVDQVKTLHGLIPICAHCHRIRDDEDAWQMMEVYIQEHSDAQFSHGLCPECAEAYYPELARNGEDGEPAGCGPSRERRTDEG